MPGNQYRKWTPVAMYSEDGSHAFERSWAEWQRNQCQWNNETQSLRGKTALSFREEKTKPITNGLKMSLLCVYDKWRIKQIGWWVPWEEIKWLNIQTPTFFSRAANKESVWMPQWGGGWEGVRYKSQAGHCCKQTSRSDSSAGSRWSHLSSWDVIFLWDVLRALCLLGSTAVPSSNSCPGTWFTAGEGMA